jgi:hypothetical protein
VRNIGDLYAIDLDGNQVGFFQHVANDTTQLSSHVICVFDVTQQKSITPDFEHVTSSTVRFYAHVLLKAGEVLGLWKKVGRLPLAKKTLPTWYMTADTDWAVGTSQNWLTWLTNQPMTTAKLDSNDLNGAEIGVVINPQNIKTRLISGRYQLAHPRRPGT